ncbi:MAG TPA: pantoate--beta-alanine ligase [Gemmatimonadaceae bacterium]
MKIIRTVAALRASLAPARRAGRRIGLVPTMGFFHEGHLSLMRRARDECDEVVVSLFVNPTQFNENSDLAAYPRDEARDTELAASTGADYLFAPSVEEIYPAGFSTSVHVSGVSEPLEGAHRGPTHFRGVATVVAKLFAIAQPDVAYFGQKDAQQVLVVTRMVRDLDMPVHIEVCPTVREPDGLAMSSRNARLSATERQQALALKRGLDAAREAIIRGERDAGCVRMAGESAMRGLGVEPEYFAVADAESLAPIDRVRGAVLLAVAARVGSVRLIDNERVDIQ